MKKRYLNPPIEELCFGSNKMTFLSGPRQCGKTTVSKMFLSERKEGEYYNWDDFEFKKVWAKSPKEIIRSGWGTSSKKSIPLVVLDEIHKSKGWKNKLKGIYDTLGNPTDILVTGSARLNIYKKGSDSLLGRYFNFRLHPFSVAELAEIKGKNPNNLLDSIWGSGISYRKEFTEINKSLLKFGAFPEPFLAQNEKQWRLWLRGRVEKIVREDLRDLSRIVELSNLEALALILPQSVGSSLSTQSLSEDLGVSFNTMKRWLSYFRELYYSFELKPYSNKIKRSLKKDSKLYLWDYSQVEDQGARFENFVANHLLKACHFWTDSGEGDFELFYLRNKGKKELDFLITKDKKPWLPVEAKLSETEPSSNFKIFMPQLRCTRALQIINKQDYLKRHKLDDYELIVASADRILPYFV